MQFDVNALIIAASSTVVSAAVGGASWIFTSAVHQLVSAIKEMKSELVELAKTQAVHNQRLNDHDRQFEEVWKKVA